MIKNMREKTQIRKFGIVALLFFAFLSLFLSYSGKNSASNVFMCFAFLGLLLILFPLRLRPIHTLWTLAGRCIGKLINALVLGVFYYLFLTPFSLFRRLFFNPPLVLSIDRSIASYWVARETFAQPKERFFKRF